MWSSHWKVWFWGLGDLPLGVWVGPGELLHQICAKGGSNGAFLGEDLGTEQLGPRSRTSEQKTLGPGRNGPPLGGTYWLGTNVECGTSGFYSLASRHW